MAAILKQTSNEVEETLHNITRMHIVAAEVLLGIVIPDDENTGDSGAYYYSDAGIGNWDENTQTL